MQRGDDEILGLLELLDADYARKTRRRRDLWQIGWRHTFIWERDRLPAVVALVFAVLLFLCLVSAQVRSCIPTEVPFFGFSLAFLVDLEGQRRHRMATRAWVREHEKMHGL